MLTSSELDQAIAASWDRQLDWLNTLVGFPSQRGLEGPCQDWIAAAFRTRGWSVDRYVLSDVDMEHLPGHSPVRDTDYPGRSRPSALARSARPP